MKAINTLVTFTLLSVGLSGCQFHARSADDYAGETKQLLAAKNDQIKTCYDSVLASNQGAKGEVVVDFTVEAKTGAIKDPTVNAEKTTAPEPLQKCVLDAMAGLQLDPPDAREGVASFAYEFTANAPKQL